MAVLGLDDQGRPLHKGDIWVKTERGDRGQGICPVGSWGHASWAERAAGTRGLEQECVCCVQGQPGGRVTGTQRARGEQEDTRLGGGGRH